MNLRAYRRTKPWNRDEAARYAISLATTSGSATSITGVRTAAAAPQGTTADSAQERLLR
jgi:hypothetical protein